MARVHFRKGLQNGANPLGLPQVAKHAEEEASPRNTERLAMITDRRLVRQRWRREKMGDLHDPGVGRMGTDRRGCCRVMHYNGLGTFGDSAEHRVTEVAFVGTAC